MRSPDWRVVCSVVLLTILALGLRTGPSFAQSATSPTLTAGGTISYAPGAGAVVVDPDLTITGSAGAMLDAAVVSIGAGFLPAEDTLGISGQAGTAGTVNDLAWSYDTETGMMTLTGEATLLTYQAALRQVTFSNAGTTRLVADRSVSISLGSALYYFENGHFYEFVSAARVSWTDAKQAAEAMTYGGLEGYLVTVTTAGENDFVTDILIGNAWMGASDADHDKEWYWETGPEIGTHFFTQAADEEGCGKGPASTQPPGDYFENWNPASPEPNDFPDGCTDGENYGNFSRDGRWNDSPDSGGGRAFGYVVEYGGLEGEPTDAPVATILVQAYEPSITIEKAWVGDDPGVTISFTVVPEVDGCTAEQTVSLPAGQASVDVSAAEQAGDTDCTYKVSETASDGYTASPDQVTGVAVGGTAAFTNRRTPVDALPPTGSTSRVLVIVGFALAGSGWFLLGGGRRRLDNRSIDDVDPVDVLPASAWTDQVAAPAIAIVGDSPTGSAFIEAIATRDPQLDNEPPAAIQTAVVEAIDTISKQGVGGAHGIIEDLLQLLEDLAEH